MKTVLCALLLSGSFLLAQDSMSADNGQQASANTKGQVTVRGCVSRFNGDFILMQQEPAVTYELHGTGKVKVARYMGQQVEATGKESPSLSTSSDSIARTGSPAPVTLNVSSIKTVSKDCPVQGVSTK